jgi:hypothetical protein
MEKREKVPSRMLMANGGKHEQDDVLFKVVDHVKDIPLFALCFETSSVTVFSRIE